jgi:predicted GNAT family N-acyltransferase
VEVVEFGGLTDAYRAELEGDEDDPFDGRGTELSWRRKERHVALRGDDGRLVASTGLLLTEIQVDAGPIVPVVGIGGVFVAASHRGQGLSIRVIVEALRLAGTLGPYVVILFCHRNRAGLYVRHQFVEIPPPVLVQQPDGFAEIPLVAMWRTLREGVSLPRGRVKVLSLPF